MASQVPGAPTLSVNNASLSLGAAPLAVPGLVPGTLDAINPFAAAKMVLDYAQALHAASFDKVAVRFNISPQEAFTIAATMFQFAMHAGSMAGVMAKAAADMNIPDGYAQICLEYVAPDSIFDGGTGRPPAGMISARPAVATRP